MILRLGIREIKHKYSVYNILLDTEINRKRDLSSSQSKIQPDCKILFHSIHAHFKEK